MTLDKLILILIYLSKNGIKGKTLLQKRIYFLSIFLNKDYGFRAHYYGPYSPLVEDSLAKVKSLGFVEERSIGYGLVDHIGFEVRRYDYVLTDDGIKIVEKFREINHEEYKIFESAYQHLVDSGDTGDHVSLSIAAKIHYIVSKSSSVMNISEIRKRAENLGWNITQDVFKNAIDFLKNMKLVETESEE